MFQIRAVILRPILSSCLSRGYVNNRYESRHPGGYYGRRSNNRFHNEEQEVGLEEEELSKLEGFAREREVVRNVYKESIVTSSRTDAEIKEFFNKHSITVEGSVPKPVLTINELEALPDLVKKEFNQRRIITPTPIQSMCWPIAMSGEDMIGIAQTGSGKTLGYLLPSALHVQAQPKSTLKGPTSLVLAPTRELVQQIAKVATEWLTFHLGIRNIGVYGGSDRNVQIRGLNSGCELCIATPGRLIDLLNSRMTSLANSSMLILDEADRMLDMGFEPQIREIIDMMREDRQTLMFSATWPKDVRQLASDFMDRNANRVNIGSTELCANKDIHQEIRITTSNKKKNMLFDIIHSRPNDKILIFAGTKRVVSSLCRDLLQSGVRVVESHGDLSQAKRERALHLFQGRANVMIATDVAARGLDVQNINLVLNFDFPQTVEDYVHRIGRTGRSGTKGQAITFFTEDDAAFARGLIEVLNQADQEVPLGLKDIANRSGKRSAQSFRNASAPRAKTFSRLSDSADWRRAARVR